MLLGTPELLIFLVLSVIAVIAALGMLLSSSAIYSALFLVVNFGVIATFYLLLGAPFIAMAQVTIYAGAIMVLFLFVIMLLGAEQLKQSSHNLLWQRPLSIVLITLLLSIVFYVVLGQGISTKSDLIQTAAGYGSPSAVGTLLFQKYLFPFEVTSILLLAAMVGAVVLTGVGRQRRRIRKSRRL